MSAPDFINGSFEILGGLFICFSIYRLYKDKHVRGVSVIHVLFFTLWGFWNLYYYPSLGQIWSFIGGIVVVSANTAWVAMIIYYKFQESKKKTIMYQKK